MAYTSIALPSLRRALLLALASLSFTARPLLAGSAENSTVYKVKAGFVFNFAKLTTWPPESIDATKPLVIGVAGPADAYEILSSALHGKMQGARKVEVVRISTAEETKGIGILYLAGSSEKELSELLASVGPNVLTISDTPDFAHRDGIIAFFERDGKIRFRVNPANARKAGLKLNSQLATLAEVVGS